MLKLNAIREGVTEKDKPIKPGDVVEYLGHLPGGCVGVKLKDGTEDVAHPACFKELQ